MTTVYADFNALTEDHSVSMTTMGSMKDIAEFRVRSGDWVWLSDGEMQVGARIAEDDRRELVAVPDWDTVIDFQPGGVNNDYASRINGELQRLIKNSAGHSPDDERRILGLLFQFERAASREILDLQPGYLAYRRAIALYFLGKFELALMEIEDALSVRPDDSRISFLFLELLRRINPSRAVLEAERIASIPDATAGTLVAAINILATHGEDLPDDEFVLIARRTREFYERFEHSPGRAQVAASLLSLVHFNRGLILLRLGETGLARAALELAHAIDPIDMVLDEATRLVAYDQSAREIAARFRAKISAAA